MDYENKYSHDLKALQGKLMTVSGYIIAMRSDTLNDHKKLDADLKYLIKHIKTIKRNLEIYFIIILFLVFIILQNLTWGNVFSWPN